MSRSDRFFRRLLRLFPAEFRSDFGDDMTQTFKDHRDEVVARGGAMAQLRLWKDTVLGVLTTAPREHWDLLRQDIRYGLRSLRRNPAVRSALGASQVRVVRQLLTESLVLAVSGAAAGLCLAFGIMQAFLPMAGDSLPRPEDIRLNGRVVAFTITLALVTPLLFGVMPALRSAMMSTAAALTDGARTSTPGRRRHRLLGALVVAQCALALVLSVGAGLLLRSFVRLTQTDTGFHAAHVVNATMALPSGRYATGAQVKTFYREAVAAAAALPGVASVGAATFRPLNVRERRGIALGLAGADARDVRAAL